EILAGINQQDTPPPLSLHTPEMTISRSDGAWSILSDDDFYANSAGELVASLERVIGDRGVDNASFVVITKS
ncbi:hypothetical protein, partial [Aeromonas allosaccharophila]|uniref:hypothetical protein n=1 Tax=Aeromonas allosaccharophila TaxID=656 RepID=UPI002B4A93CB